MRQAVHWKRMYEECHETLKASRTNLKDHTAKVNHKPVLRSHVTERSGYTLAYQRNIGHVGTTAPINTAEAGVSRWVANRYEGSVGFQPHR